MEAPETKPENPVEVVIPSDHAEAGRVQREIEQRLRTIGYTDREVFKIHLALEEAMINAIKHGNQMDFTKKVYISYQVSQEEFGIVITDEGHGFDPAEIPDPTLAENLERPCGRGIMLMRHYMSKVEYNDKGNGVRMEKRRSEVQGEVMKVMHG